MKFYKLLDVVTGEYVCINPKHIIFYKRTDHGVLIDIGSKQFIVVQADVEDMMRSEMMRGEGVEEW